MGRRTRASSVGCSQLPPSEAGRESDAARRLRPCPRCAVARRPRARDRGRRQAVTSRSRRRGLALCSTSSLLRRRAAGISFSARSSRSSSDAASRSSSTDLARDDRVPPQLVQLRLPPPSPIRARRRALRASRRRADRDVSRLRRRNRRANRRAQRLSRRRDDRAVAVQPGRASGARDRARGATSDLEHRRPERLPPAGRARCARRAARPPHRVELVGQPEQGRRRPHVARPKPRPRSLRADVRRTHGRNLRAHPRPRSDPDRASRRGAPAERRLSSAEPQRPLLQRPPRGARERAPRGLPCERRSSRAGRGRGSPVRRARPGCRRARSARRGARRAARCDPRASPSERSRTATSRSSGDDGAVARGTPGACRRASLRGVTDARMAPAFAPVRGRGAHELVGRRGRPLPRGDRAAARLRRRAFRLGALRGRSVGLPHEPLRGAAAALARTRRTRSRPRTCTVGRGRRGTPSSIGHSRRSARRLVASRRSR